MREIKFRLWVDEEMEYDVRFTGDDLSFNDEIKKKGTNLMQYTGLKDKNGKEIYEGDILLNEDGMGDLWRCDFSDGCFEYTLLNIVPRETIPAHEPQGFKVIGNKYENPKLLKKVNEL